MAMTVVDLLEMIASTSISAVPALLGHSTSSSFRCAKT